MRTTHPDVSHISLSSFQYRQYRTTVSTASVRFASESAASVKPIVKWLSLPW